MATQTVSLRRQMIPWSRHAVWWLILIEGVLALLIGLLLLALPPTGLGVTLIAMYLIGDGIYTAVQQLRQKNLDRAGAVKLMHGTVGIAVGLSVVIPRILIGYNGPPIDSNLLGFSARTINEDLLNGVAFQVLIGVGGTGLLFWSILHFWEAFLDDDRDSRLSELLIGLGFLVLSVLGLLELARDTNLGIIPGVFFLFVGMILVLVAVLQRTVKHRRTGHVEPEPEPVIGDVTLDM